MMRDLLSLLFADDGANCHCGSRLNTFSRYSTISHLLPRVWLKLKSCTVSIMPLITCHKQADRLTALLDNTALNTADKFCYLGRNLTANLDNNHGIMYVEI